ncbi:MAG: helix-turn-helix transcriptional regulator [Clostridia bacterium]|nr:helix-turn-helix transcriptional regulator [Clostridia bacterium]MBQ9792272.1 helix-turn-helix transcriptional regulator [Clostridia bacterium]
MRLKEVREQNKKTQTEIAEFLHIRQNTYSQYENNQRQIPIEHLISLAKYYDVSVDYILGLTEIDYPYPTK